MIRKVAEEQDPNQGEINYLDIRSQNKLSYWGPKNWILLQDLNTNKKWYFWEEKIRAHFHCYLFTERKWKFKEKINIIHSDNAG